MKANLPRGDRQLSRSGQLQVSEGKHPLERAVSKPQNHLCLSADQLDDDLSQKEDGRNRNQVDIPLHVASQSSRRFNFGFRVQTLASATRLAGSINPNGSLPTRLNRS